MENGKLHPLVNQLVFTRSEWERVFENLSEEDAYKHIGPMNCLSWIVGHLAWHEQSYWLEIAQEKIEIPDLESIAGYGSLPSSPTYKDMWKAWYKVTSETDKFLHTLQSKDLIKNVYYTRGEKERSDTLGTMMQRLIYHYWFHIGEVHAIRQNLGHDDLPEFVGNIKHLAPYTQESP